MRKATILITAVMLADILAPAVPAWGADGYEYSDEIEVYTYSSSWSRTLEKVTPTYYQSGGHYDDWGNYQPDYVLDDGMYTDIPCDDEFMRYILGDTGAMDPCLVENPSSDGTYYRYGQGYSSYNTKTFEYPHQYFNLEPGTYKIKIDAETTSNYEYFYLRSASFDYYGPSLYPGQESEVTISKQGAYYFAPYSSSMNGMTITVNLSKAPITGTDATTSGTEMRVGTQYTWYTGSIELSEESLSLNGSNFRVAKAGSYEDTVLKQMAESGSLTFGSYNNSYVSEGEGTYNIYSLGEPTADGYKYKQGSSSSNVSIDLNPMAKDVGCSFYMGAYSDFTIAVDGELNGYLLLEADNGGTTVLEPGKRYTLTNDLPATYRLTAHLLYADDYADNGFVSLDVEIHGNSIPDGNAGILAVVLILVCVIFFGLLFVSGLKPKWSKK